MSEQHEVPEGIILDTGYADAFLAVAARDGYAEIEPPNEGNEHLHKRLREKLADSDRIRKALELALLCGEVQLHDCTSIARPIRLVEEGIVGSWLPRDEISLSSLTEIPEPVFLERTDVMKPLVIEHLIQRFEESHASRRASQAISAAEARQEAEWLVPRFYDFFAYTYAGRFEEGVEKSGLRSLLESLFGDGDLVRGFAEFRASYDEKALMSGFELDMMIMARELAGTISLHDRSAGMHLPFASKRVSLFAEERDGIPHPQSAQLEEEQIAADALAAVYSLCVIPFRKEVRFAPVVNSIDDLLRLRERREIARFREVLGEWQRAVLNREPGVETRIREDIAKANKEMKKLEKWRNVDRWLYRIAVPAAFVPEISGAVTIASFLVRKRIEKAERLHDWINIGR